jgi:hypothetical protein
MLTGYTDQHTFRWVASLGTWKQRSLGTLVDQTRRLLLLLRYSKVEERRTILLKPPPENGAAISGT